MSTNTGQATFNLSSLAATENQSLVLVYVNADARTGSYRFQWQRSFDAENWFDITGATSLSFLPGDNEVNAILRARVQYTDGAGNAETVYSPETGLVVNVNDVPVSTLAFKGVFQQGVTIQVTGGITDGDMAGGIVPADQLAWQWLAGGLPIDGANSSTFALTQAEVGKLISLQVSYVDRFGTPEKLTLASTQAVSNVNDPAVGSIAIDYAWELGFVEHNTLYASAALFDLDGPGDVPANRLSWQWYSGATAIAGATQASLVLSQAMVGRSIRVEVRFTDDLKSTEVLSLTLKDGAGRDLLVENFDDPPVGSLTLSGTATQGQTLSVTGSITDADGIPATGAGAPTWNWLISNWMGDYDPIPGATGTRLVLTQAMVGASVVACYRYVDGFGNATEVRSLPSATIADLQEPPSGSVLVSGSLVEDGVLIATPSFTDPDGISTDLAWQWFADGSPIADAVSDSYQLTQAEVGKAITVTASYSDGLGKLERVSGSAGASRVGNVDDPHLGAVWIADGEAVQGARLVAANDLSDEDGIPLSGPGSLVYQWFQDGQLVPGAVGTSLLLDQTHVGHQIQVRATYTDRYGTQERVFSDATGPVENVNDPPVHSLRIQGIARQREWLSLTGTLSDVDLFGAVPASAMRWQWFVGADTGQAWDAFAQPIDSASGPSIRLGQAEVGRIVSVRVAYTDSFGWEESVDVIGSGVVQNVNDPPVGAVAILGFEQRPQQGQTLIADAVLSDIDVGGDIPAETLTWQWYANDLAIPGATTSALEMTQSVVGKAIRVVASYADNFGRTESVSSATTPAVENLNDEPTGALTITGTARQGRVLSVIGLVEDLDGIPVSGPGAPTFEWLADGQPIESASGSTLELKQAHVAHVISVRYRYVDAFGQPETVESDAVGPVQDAQDPVSGSIRLEGLLQEDETLTAVVAFTDPDGLGEITWRWWVGDDELPGENDSELLLRPEFIGKRVEVEASYVDGGGESEQVRASTGSLTVRNVNDPPTNRWGDGPATVVIDDAEWDGAVQGQTLTFTMDIADEDGIPETGAFSFQWLVDGKPLAGATGAALTLTQSVVGHEVSVRVGYVDLMGTPESIVSDALPVLNVNDPWTGGLAIRGKPAVGALLSVQSSLLDPDGFGNGVVYQWMADGTPIAGAQGPWWRVTREQAGALIGVEANWIDGGGYQESAQTTASGPVELSSAQGEIYHWRSHALLSDLKVSLTGEGLPASALSQGVGQQAGIGGTPVRTLDLRSVGLDEAGNLTAELWVDASVTPISAFSLSLSHQGGTTLNFQPEFNPLPARWSVPQATTAQTGELLSLDYFNPSGIPIAWPTRLGVLTLVASGSEEPLRIALESGAAGQIVQTPVEPFGVTIASVQSGSDGGFAFPELDFDRYAIVISGAPAIGVNPVTSADALAALKIAVGRNPNPDPDGPGPLQAPGISPYQRIAADVDGNGVIDRTDVGLILQMAAGYSKPSWIYANEALSPTANPHAVVTGTTALNLVGVLLGDVDGSWVPGDESGQPLSDFARQDVEHFQALYRDIGIPYEYFGIIDTNPING